VAVTRNPRMFVLVTDDVQSLRYRPDGNSDSNAITVRVRPAWYWLLHYTAHQPCAVMSAESRR